MYHGIHDTRKLVHTTVVPSSPLSFLPPASDGNYRSDMQIATVTANAWLTVTLLTDRYTMSTRRRCTASVIIRARVYFTLVTPPTSHPQTSSTRFVPTPWRKFGFIGRTVKRKEKEEEREKKGMESMIFNASRVSQKRYFPCGGWVNTQWWVAGHEYRFWFIYSRGDREGYEWVNLSRFKFKRVRFR